MLIFRTWHFYPPFPQQECAGGGLPSRVLWTRLLEMPISFAIALTELSFIANSFIFSMSTFKGGLPSLIPSTSYTR